MSEDTITVEKLKGRFPEAVLDVKEFRGETTITVRAEDLVEVCRFLRDDPDLRYDLLIHVTGVDYSAMGRQPRFQAVYNLFSLSQTAAVCASRCPSRAIRPPSPA